MRIDQVLPNVSGATPARAAVSAQRWLVGQLLTIGVIGRVDESSIRLAIDGREVLAHTALKLEPGSTYSARVTTAGAQPQLSILSPPLESPLRDAPSPLAATLRAAMNTSLPTQEPLRAVLSQIAERPGAAIASVAPQSPGAPTLQARVVTLTAQLPELPALADAAQLRRAVADAGPLLEARLASIVDQDRPPLPTQDLKFQLLNLRQAVDVQLGGEAPGRAGPAATPGAPDIMQAQASLRALAADVDAGVARITTHQLQHLAAAEHGDFFAFAEIPFRSGAGIDTLTLAIESEGDDEPAFAHGEDDSTGHGLAVNLAVPLGGLGELRARIGLAGDRLAVTLWSEQLQLRELIREDIDELESRLHALGFELTPIAVREVTPVDPLRHRPARLIDTSA